MKQKRKIIGALCFLVLFIIYQTSISAFTHIHYIDGVLITHSHPFNGTHSHSTTSFSVIGFISALYSPKVDACENLHPMRALLAVLKVDPATPTVKGEVIRALSLRAPPSVSF
ncbi:hypothetical protein [uncultured Bacteroides sp.]|uniref:hypothetical protein n=1 Tax=uncultured Bacteroides sp. TaxID=162156 RepID=UPI0025DE8CF1|nr:hypothetical protein [uncultured Bacteroides sp.]